MPHQNVVKFEVIVNEAQVVQCPQTMHLHKNVSI
jgi:hypothetical protein